MNIALGGDPDQGQRDSELEEEPDAAGNVARFLKDHKTAKIVVIVDTHCLNNGAFVYTGNSPDSYLGCMLPEVSTPDYRLYQAAHPPGLDPCRLSPTRGLPIYLR
jgi:hypothetical protein